MTYTTHGHHIPGSIKDDGDAPRVARCGGPGLCASCSAQVAEWDRATQKEKVISDLDKASVRHEALLTPKRYSSKPVEIEAIQFVGGASNGLDIVDWIIANGGNATWRNGSEPWTSDDGTTGHAGWPESLTIESLEGWMEAPPSWWIIRGTQGEFYPCRDDVFQLKYEEIAADG